MCRLIPQWGSRDSDTISLFPYDLVSPDESVGSERMVRASPFFASPTGLAEGPLPGSLGMLAGWSCHPAASSRYLHPLRVWREVETWISRV